MSRSNIFATPKASQKWLLMIAKRWKVTSQFVLRLSPTKTLQCARVTALGQQFILHLSRKEFERMFTVMKGDAR